MLIRKFGVIGLLVENAVEAIADRLFRSSLEKDFGAASEDDIILPDARHVVRGELNALKAPLVRVFSSVDGLMVEKHLAKVLQRLPEMRVRRPITYAFQAKDAEHPVELQMNMMKHHNHEIEIDFRSSEAVISQVQVAFKTS